MSAVGVPAPVSRARYAQLADRARLLSWLSLAWMTVEGGVAITAGIMASSVALVGFGLDSVIEGLASVVIIWRFSGHRVFSHAAEERAQRLVAVQFFLLAPYVAYESLQALVVAEHPDVSWVGVALSASSVVIMPLLGRAKQRLADEMGSAATRGEGRQNMLCAYLAAALLVGLVANAAVGAWWLDPAVGLLIAAVAVREGLESWRGEGCCVSSPLDGAGFADTCCDEGPGKPAPTERAIADARARDANETPGANTEQERRMAFANFMAGTAGRALRALAGIALITAGLITGGTAGTILAVVGLLPLAAGVFGFCLLGPLLGVSLTHRPPSATS